jgi:prepilin-type N-terminal cleavage/methylation domain-containing protein
MQFVKHIARETKAGYTLVEVLVVVTIMGILSSMGVAGLQRAVANARVKDAALNTAAFVERVANLSSQRNEVLCLKVAPGNHQNLLVIRDTINFDCSNPKGPIDSLIIDAPSQFVGMNKCGPVVQDWFTSAGMFKPKLGLSAAPPEGGVCVQYGDDNIYGAVRKERTVNRVIPMWKVMHDGTKDSDWSNWTDL